MIPALLAALLAAAPAFAGDKPDPRVERFRRELAQAKTSGYSLAGAIQWDDKLDGLETDCGRDENCRVGAAALRREIVPDPEAAQGLKIPFYRETLAGAVRWRQFAELCAAGSDKDSAFFAKHDLAFDDDGDIVSAKTRKPVPAEPLLRYWAELHPEAAEAAAAAALDRASPSGDAAPSGEASAAGQALGAQGDVAFDNSAGQRGDAGAPAGKVGDAMARPSEGSPSSGQTAPRPKPGDHMPAEAVTPPAAAGVTRESWQGRAGELWRGFVRGLGRDPFQEGEGRRLSDVAARAAGLLRARAADDPDALARLRPLLARYEAITAETDWAVKSPLLRAWQTEADALLQGAEDPAARARRGASSELALGLSLADLQKRDFAEKRLLEADPQAARLKDIDPEAYAARLNRFVKEHQAELEKALAAEPDFQATTAALDGARRRLEELRRADPDRAAYEAALADYRAFVARAMVAGKIPDGAELDPAAFGLPPGAARPGTLASVYHLEGRPAFRYTAADGAAIELASQADGSTRRSRSEGDDLKSIEYLSPGGGAFKRLEGRFDAGTLVDGTVTTAAGATRLKSGNFVMDGEGGFGEESTFTPAGASKPSRRVVVFYDHGGRPLGYVDEAFDAAGGSRRTKNYFIAEDNGSISIRQRYADRGRMLVGSLPTLPGKSIERVAMEDGLVKVFQEDDVEVALDDKGNKTVRRGTKTVLPDGTTIEPLGPDRRRIDDGHGGVTTLVGLDGGALTGVHGADGALQGVSLSETSVARLRDAAPEDRALYARHLAEAAGEQLAKPWSPEQRGMAAQMLARYAGQPGPAPRVFISAQGDVVISAGAKTYTGQFKPEGLLGGGPALVVMSGDLGFDPDTTARLGRYIDGKVNLPRDVPRFEIAADGSVTEYAYSLELERGWDMHARAEVFSMHAVKDGRRTLVAQYDALSYLSPWGRFSKAINDATPIGASAKAGRPLMDLGKVLVNWDDAASKGGDAAVAAAIAKQYGLDTKQQQAMSRLMAESDLAQARETLAFYFSLDGAKSEAENRQLKEAALKEILDGLQGSPQALQAVEDRLRSNGLSEMKSGMAWRAGDGQPREVQDRLVRLMFSPSDDNLRLQGFDRLNIDNRHKEILDAASEAHGLTSVGLYALGYAHQTTVMVAETLPGMILSGGTGGFGKVAGLLQGQGNVMLAWGVVDGLGNLASARSMQEARYGVSDVIANVGSFGVFHYGAKALAGGGQPERSWKPGELEARVQEARLNLARDSSPANEARLGELKASGMQRLLRSMIRDNPEAAADLGHLSALEGVKIRFETGGELPADAAAHYDPAANEVVFSRKLLEVPNTKLVETLAHELQHAHDEAQAGRTLPANYDNELRAHEVQNRVQDLMERRLKDFNEKHDTDRVADKTWDGKTAQSPEAKAYLDTMAKAREAWTKGGRDGLMQYVRETYRTQEGIVDLGSYQRELVGQIGQLDAIAGKLGRGERPSPLEMRRLETYLAERGKGAPGSLPLAETVAALKDAVASREALIDAAKIDARADLAGPARKGEAAETIPASADPARELIRRFASNGAPAAQAYALASAELAKAGLTVEGVAGSFGNKAKTPRLRAWPETMTVDGRAEPLTFEDAAKLDKMPSDPSIGARLTGRNKAIFELKQKLLKEGGLPSDLDVIARGDHEGPGVEETRRRIFEKTGVYIELVEPLEAKGSRDAAPTDGAQPASIAPTSLLGRVARAHAEGRQVGGAFTSDPMVAQEHPGDCQVHSLFNLPALEPLRAAGLERFSGRVAEIVERPLADVREHGLTATETVKVLEAFGLKNRGYFAQVVREGTLQGWLAAPENGGSMLGGVPGHAMTVIGYEVLPSGEWQYFIKDSGPSAGGQIKEYSFAQLKARGFEVMNLDLTKVTLEAGTMLRRAGLGADPNEARPRPGAERPLAQGPPGAAGAKRGELPARGVSSKSLAAVIADDAARYNRPVKSGEANVRPEYSPDYRSKDPNVLFRAGPDTAGRLRQGGRYNYVLLADGTMEIAEVKPDNARELGVKHVQIANRRPLVFSGELVRDAQGRLRVDLNSGTYSEYGKDARWAPTETNLGLLKKYASAILGEPVEAADHNPAAPPPARVVQPVQAARPPPPAPVKPARPGPPLAAGGYKLVRGEPESFDFAKTGPLRLSLGDSVVEIHDVLNAPAALAGRMKLDGVTKLVVYDPRTGSYRKIAEGMTLELGRDPQSDIALGDPRVSRKHVRVSLRDGKLVLEDLSSHGTRVEALPPERK